MSLMKKKYKVAILRGGTSDEHSISLKSGEQLKNRIDDLQNITDITVDRAGQWFVQGIPYEKKNLVRDFDMVVNTMKGGEGENGRLSKYLDTFGVTTRECLEVPFHITNMNLRIFSKDTISKLLILY
jgi:D-alanine-D-alanine ligase-like ATP-grasp enzyme